MVNVLNPTEVEVIEQPELSIVEVNRKFLVLIQVDYLVDELMHAMEWSPAVSRKFGLAHSVESWRVYEKFENIIQAEKMIHIIKTLVNAWRKHVKEKEEGL